jgi:ADP-ribose pyrophosphatase YjhB (NUDIX family)
MRSLPNVYVLLQDAQWGTGRQERYLKGALTWLWGRLPLTPRMRTALIWLLSPKFTVGVVALVRDEQGRVLLLRHTYRPGREWGLPGGGLHAHESLEDCLRREVYEETGMQVEIDALLSAAAHRDRRLVDMIFACHPAPGQSLDSFRPNPEVDEARYFAPDELPAEMSRGQRRLLSVALGQAERNA